ncbi:MerC mercury resistance protein [Seminavis robusta]|uniref:MerC mercury resistance protein n=1 Tax=Seminavis robusta TaxID=568900 RepID=A0A9N8HV79_9STRA|nr:MerC mercury resistance protein [Seminavis robusta]|eukprot:Sro1759_g295800.1 MerC mercury resistance protein (256) ;mRNA; f:8371-9138
MVAAGYHYRRLGLLVPVSLIMFLAFLNDAHAAFASLSPTGRVSRSSKPSLLPLTRDVTPSPTRLTSATNSESSSSPPEVTGWRGQLLKASNIASLLCVLDCTVLPVVTVVLPFFGLVAASPAQMEFLHHLGHQVALFFVLPVGGSATLLNYLYAHRQKRIASLGVLGLVMVLAANAPHGLLHAVHDTVLLKFLYPLLHAVHHGITHRLVNILGCACLLGSNYLSKQSGKCLHGHDHSECADSGHSHSHSQHDHDH